MTQMSTPTSQDWLAWIEALVAGHWDRTNHMGQALVLDLARAGATQQADRLRRVLDTVLPPVTPPPTGQHVRPAEEPSWRLAFRPRLYIAGPMSGYEDYNFPAFFAAQTALEACGYSVINPATTGLHEDWTWHDYLRVGIERLVRGATGVAVLPGWDNSRGAQLEVHVARALDLPVQSVEAWMTQK